MYNYSIHGSSVRNFKRSSSAAATRGWAAAPAQREARTARAGARRRQPALPAVEETRGCRGPRPALRRTPRGVAPQDSRSLSGETPPVCPRRPRPEAPPSPRASTAPAPASREPRRRGRAARSPGGAGSPGPDPRSQIPSAPPRPPAGSDLWPSRPEAPPPSLPPPSGASAAQLPREARPRESCRGGGGARSRESGAALPAPGMRARAAAPRAIGGARPPLRRRPRACAARRRAVSPGACVCVCHPPAARRPRERSRPPATRDRAPGTRRAG